MGMWFIDIIYRMGGAQFELKHCRILDYKKPLVKIGYDGGERWIWGTRLFLTQADANRSVNGWFDD